MNEGQHNNMIASIYGDNWNNNTNAGVFTLNLNNNHLNSNNNVDRRDSKAKPETTIKVDTGNRGICCPAKSEIIRDGFSSNYAESQTISKRTKKIGYLFNETFTLENLYLAYLNARKGKRKKRVTLEFETSLGSNLNKLYEELHNGNYKPLPYIQFIVCEPKKRIINAPAFRDLVVQHAIYMKIYRIYDITFIDTSFACRKGGGTHKASKYTQLNMRKYNGELYYLKLDIRKFFYSIDRNLLKTLFEKKIKDKRFIDIMCAFANMTTDEGIPIGNLLSQIYALIYLNPLDHFAKRILKIKSYVRYVDDIVMIGLTLNKAKELKIKCEEFINQKLHLKLSHWTIQKIKKGINFVGYRTWKSIKFVRKYSMYKFKKAVKKYKIESIVSCIGHAKGTATLSYYKDILNEYGLLNQIPARSLQCLSM